MIDQIIDQTVSGKGDSDQHAITLFGLVLSLKAKVVVELGVRNGDSTRPLLAAAFITDGYLHSVDIEPAPKIVGASDNILSRWRFYQQDAIEFLKTFDQQIDVAFVDDWHDGDHVYEELQLLASKMTKSGLILMHDTMHTGSHPEYNKSKGDQYFGHYGPYGALQRLDKSVWEYVTIPVSHGLTILRKI